MMTAPATANSAGKTVRRFIVFVLLFVLVTIAANGLAGLLARAVDPDVLLTDADTSGLATGLAFTLIAGPLAAVLWWFAWRGLGDRAERGSVLWGLYLAGMSTLALILGAWFLLTTASTLVSGVWDPHSFAAGLVWTAVWVWHRWMSYHPKKSPTRLAAGARVLGYVFGIAIGATAWIQLVSALVDLTVASSLLASSGYSWWVAPMQNVVWVIGGAAIWWMHWVLAQGALLRTGFASVVLVLVTGLVAVGLTVFGVATAIYVALRFAFEKDLPASAILDPLGFALGTASVGAVLWAGYRLVVRRASPATQLGTRLVSSGVALAAAATGIGILINSVLAALVAPLAESDSRSLLYGGFCLLLVGGPAWWLIWKPLEPATERLARETGRRVYLFAVFGISALVAIITLLVIAFQVFDVALAGEVNGSLIDRVGASLGLLAATVLVGVYHFSTWRRDRALAPSEEARLQTIERVVLVAGADAEAAVRAIRDATGAVVTVWTRSDEKTGLEPDAIVAALAGVGASRVLVVTGSTGVQVIPLEE